MIHLILGAALLGLALLTVIRPPSSVFWQLSILPREWGHTLALLCLPLLWPAWHDSALDRIGAGLAFGAATLLLTPLVRSSLRVRGLTAAMEQTFGPTPMTAGDRPAPLRFRDLWLGVRYRRSAVETVVYATPDGQPLHMDIYRANRTPAPAVIVIHGGSWRNGDRKQLDPLNHYLADRGFTVAAISYRLSPAARFPAARDDVLAAVSYLKTHAGILGVDPTQIVLLGRSAGGQLALVAAYTAKDPAIRGAISFYGPFDLLWGYSQPGWILDSRGILADYLGGPPDQVPQAYHDASPLSFTGPDTPPTLLIQGEADVLVAPRHSHELLKQMRAAGRPCYAVFMPHGTHGSDVNLSGPFGQISTYAVERFLRAVTK